MVSSGIMDSMRAEDKAAKSDVEAFESPDFVDAGSNVGIGGTGAAGRESISQSLYDQDNDRPAVDSRASFQLRERWPQSVLGTEAADGKSLVVCTIDVQLLTDTVNVMHTQIDLLRQTILALREDADVRKAEEKEEIQILRRKVVDLERRPSPSVTAPQGTAGVRLDKVEGRISALEQGGSSSHTGGDALSASTIAQWRVRIQRIEEVVWGAPLASQDSAETGTSGAAHGGTGSSATSEYSADQVMPSLFEEDDRAEGRKTSSPGIQGESETDYSAPAQSVEEAGDGAALALSGDLTSTLETYNSRDQERKQAARGGVVDVGGDGADQPPKVLAPATSSRKRSRLKSAGLAVMMTGGKALCSTVANMEKQLNTMIRDDREAQVAARVVALEAELRRAGNGGGGSDQIRLLLERLLRQATFLRTALVSEGLAAGGVEGEKQAQGNGHWTDVASSRDNQDRGGEHENLLAQARARLVWLQSQVGGETSKVSDCAGDVQEDEISIAEKSPRLSLSEDTVAGENEVETSMIGQKRRAAGTWDEEVEGLWRRMDDVERRVYVKIEQHRRCRKVDSLSAGSTAVLETSLRDMYASLDRSSLTLITHLEEGLASVGARIELLENGRFDQEGATASVPVTSTLESVANNAVDGNEEIPLVRQRLEGVANRVAVLEAASKLGSAAIAEGATPESVTAAAEAARAAAEQAAEQAAERAEARFIAEMSALEERIDRRARDDARRAREERETTEARTSMRRVSATVSAYTADIAARLDGLTSEHEKTGTEVARATEEIAVAEDGLRKMGAELMGLGQVANSVSTVVDGKADQTDVESLKQAMLRLDVTVAKNQGAQASRESEAISALRAAFKDMSSSMEGSIRKLQQAQQSAGSVKIKPLLDRVIRELSAAGLLPDPDSGSGAVGRSQCLSCSRPISVSGEPTSFGSYLQGKQLAKRMNTATSTPFQLHVNKPTVVWRGGFRMPPGKINAAHGQQQFASAAASGVGGAGRERGGVHSNNSGPTSGYGSRRNFTRPHPPSNPFAAADTQSLPDMRAMGGGFGRDRGLPGIPNLLDNGVGRAIVGGGAEGPGLRISSDAPHRGRFVPDARSLVRRT